MTNCDIVLNRLDDLDIHYEIAEHQRVSTMEECQLPMRLLGALMPKNIFLCTSNRSSYRLLIAHPSSRFRTSSVSKQAHTSRLSFAPDESLTMLGTYSGAVSPFGLLFDEAREISLLIDKLLLKEEYLLFHPLDNTKTVKISTEVLLHKFLPSISHGYTIVDMEESSKAIT